MILKSNHGLQQSVHRRTLDFQVVQFVHRRGVKAFGVSSCLSLSLICRENIGSFGVKHVIALWTPGAGKCIKLPGFGRFVKKEGTPSSLIKLFVFQSHILSKNLGLQSSLRLARFVDGWTWARALCTWVKSASSIHNRWLAGSWTSPWDKYCRAWNPSKTVLRLTSI